MKIVFVHYHLNRGGVTQVITSHLRALQSAVDRWQLTELMVMHGGNDQGWCAPEDARGGVRVQVETVPELDYDQVDAWNVDRLTESILCVLNQSGFGHDETILHVHNHSLGKNVSLPGALKRLAERGFRLLLHMHDFVEDLRPANYARFSRMVREQNVGSVSDYLYPSANHIHYALLNSRDRNILRSTGLDASHVHLLPNPVTAQKSLPPRQDALPRFRAIHGLDEKQQLVLYPVRGIRRKNIGELLLWSALSRNDRVFAVTLPATSDMERPAFERWRELVNELQLPVLFNVGLNDDLSLEDNMAASDRIITTSVAEGFGLTFLESWLNHRPLIGRNLPEITQDFGERGVHLDHLGDAIPIPDDWIGRNTFITEVLSIQQRLCAAYGQTISPDTELVLNERVASGQVDFAVLPTAMQVAVIRRVATDRRAAAMLLEMNRWIQDSLSRTEEEWESLIESNSAAVQRGFGLDATSDHLAQIYGTLFASACDDCITSLPHPEEVLRTFVDVRRLHPVRVEP